MTDLRTDPAPYAPPFATALPGTTWISLAVRQRAGTTRSCDRLIRSCSDLRPSCVDARCSPRESQGLVAAPASVCTAMAPNGDGIVTIGELIAAVGNALNGCG